MTPTLQTEPSKESHSLKTSLRLITSLIDTTSPVFYEARRPALRSVLSSPAGLRTVGPGTSSARPKKNEKSAPHLHAQNNIVTASPLTVQAPLDFLDVSPRSRTRAVSLALPRDSHQFDREGMPVGKLESRDKRVSDMNSPKMLRPLPKRSNTISPEMGHHNWGSLPPPRPSVQISPPVHELARFTLSPPTGTHAPPEFICDSPASAIEHSPARPGGIRSALAEPCVSQMEVTSTWSMPMTTVDRVGPRLAQWKDRLGLPKEPSLRRSASMRGGMKDATGPVKNGHKRNQSDSLLQTPSLVDKPSDRDIPQGSFLIRRPNSTPPPPEMRPTTRRSRTPIPYSMNSSSISETHSDADGRSFLSRQVSTDSLRSTTPRRGRSHSVRLISDEDSETPVDRSTRPLGVWDKVREEAVSTLANRSRRGSFTSIWQSSRFGGVSDMQTTRPFVDDLDRLQELSLEDGYDQRTQVGRKVEDNEELVGDEEEDEVFIAFEDM
jgi:hypothetical protein